MGFIQHKDEPLFEEFIQVQAPKEAKELLKTLQNTETSKSNSESDIGSKTDDEKEDKLANKKISDLEYMQLLKKSDNKSKLEKSIKEKKKLFTVKVLNKITFF